ncbi:cytochrome P450 2M1-like [Alosa sapidissima]|uniref:cytochrome P450 2M1-like n=1 Tax=Alosa sapidissima TaxID=34773 RepID=UPI001C09C0E8|nr:cytochrome P450 2M1-like [Alosa sapidissima]
MEILAFLQPNILCIVLGIVVCILVWMNRGKQRSFGRLPPGPCPVPLIGNLLQIDLKEPYKSYQELCKKYGPVCTIWLANKPVVILSGYQTIKDALVLQGEEFNGRAQYPFLEARHSGGLFNPRELLCNAVANVICSIMFGQRFEYKDPDFLLLYNAVTDVFIVLNSPIGQLYNLFPGILDRLPVKHRDMFALLQDAQAYVKREADTRLKHLDVNSTPQDYIEAFMIKMIQEKDVPNSEFHYDNLLGSVWNLFSAGTETTSSTLRQMILMMIKHPHIQARVQKEIDEVVGQERSPSMDDRSKMPYTDAVIHEVQRYMDLTPTSVPHKVTVDTEFKNYHIPKVREFLNYHIPKVRVLELLHPQVTRQCCKLSGEVFGREVTIVDTPGLFDTSLPEPTVKREISKCINMSAPGPHAILLVIKVGPFTNEEQDAVRQVEEIFGEDAWRHTIILFTQDDQAEPDIDRQLREAGPELQSILKKVENRFHCLHNNQVDDRSQVLDLLEMVEKMVDANSGQCYSNYTYIEVVEMLAQRELELREFYEKKLKEKIKAVESKYEKMLMEAQQGQPDTKKRRKRNCLGEGLARMELFLFTSSLLQRFTFVGTKPPEEIDTTPKCCSFGRLPRVYDC